MNEESKSLKKVYVKKRLQEITTKIEAEQFLREFKEKEDDNYQQSIDKNMLSKIDSGVEILEKILVKVGLKNQPETKKAFINLNKNIGLFMNRNIQTPRVQRKLADVVQFLDTYISGFKTLPKILNNLRRTLGEEKFEQLQKTADNNTNEIEKYLTSNIEMFKRIFEASDDKKININKTSNRDSNFAKDSLKHSKKRDTLGSIVNDTNQDTLDRHKVDDKQNQKHDDDDVILKTTNLQFNNNNIETLNTAYNLVRKAFQRKSRSVFDWWRGRNQFRGDIRKIVDDPDALSKEIFLHILKSDVSKQLMNIRGSFDRVGSIFQGLGDKKIDIKKVSKTVKMLGAQIDDELTDDDIQYLARMLRNARSKKIAKKP